MLELRRQIFHLIFGIFFVLLLFFNILNAWMALVLFGIALLYAIFHRYVKLFFIDWFVERFERDEPGVKFHGLVSFLLGVFIAVAFFEKQIAMAAMMILAFGDSASTIFGVLLGRKKMPWSERKTIVGTFFGIVFAFLGAVMFVSPLHAFIASVLAMTVESIDYEIIGVNDNVILPFVSGVILTML
ncbi:hypothetical protein C4573_05955 [Candidatus Woesearchaeota archaeon]|nr:MAG: hypothetical protein C4573_05955 [Candidatus Woesearchaeota archaeon]